MPNNQNKKSNDDHSEGLPFFPLIEIFGGTIGILLLFIFVLVFKQEQIREMQKNPLNISGIIQMKLGAKFGYVVSSYSDSLKIAETGETLSLADLQKPNNKFYRYCKDRFALDDQKLICFFLYPGCNNIHIWARKNIVRAGAKEYNFLIINKEIIEKLIEINEKNL